MKIFAMPYFYDALCAVAIFCAFCVIFVVGIFLVRNAGSGARWATYGVLAVIFLTLPFLNILALDGFLRRVEFIDGGSKKLIYIDSFLLSGSIKNDGKIALQRCEFGLYANRRFSPDYRVIVDGANLRVGDKIAVEQSVDNLKDAEIKKIALRCY